MVRLLLSVVARGIDGNMDEKNPLVEKEKMMEFTVMIEQ